VISDLVAGVLAGLAVAMPIGAIGTYLVGLAARERFAVAAAAALGVASVDGGFAVVASVGGAGLQTVVQRIAGALTVTAVIVLVLVATRTLQLAVRRYRRADAAWISGPSRLTPLRAYGTLMAMTVVNPATVITFAAVVLGRSAGDGSFDWATVVLFAVGAFVASAAWQLLLVSGGSLLGRLLTGRRGQLGISICSAVIMLGLAVAVLLR
jgi:arginine exporter protein ArgO